MTNEAVIKLISLIDELNEQRAKLEMSDCDGDIVGLRRVWLDDRGGDVFTITRVDLAGENEFGIPSTTWCIWSEQIDDGPLWTRGGGVSKEQAVFEFMLCTLPAKDDR